MRTTLKALTGTAAAAALAVSATPAVANDGYKKDKIDAGDVIAGALVIGGIAALAGAFDGKDKKYRSHHNRDGYRDDYRYDRAGYRGDYYNRGHRGKFHRSRIGPRSAVNRCVRAAERRAGYFGPADVTQIRDIDRTRYGYRVKGRIVVKDGYRGYDRGRFTCFIEGKRVTDVRLRGLNRH